MIRLEGVTRRYRSAAGERTALDAVDLEIGKGEVFGVVGRSGAGKSTLIRTINRLETPDAGKVFVDGKDETDQFDIVIDRKAGTATATAKGVAFRDDVYGRDG